METSVVSSVGAKTTNGQGGGDLREARLVGGGVSVRQPPGSTGHANPRLPRPQGGPSVLTGVGHPAGDEHSLRPAE